MAQIPNVTVIQGGEAFVRTQLSDFLKKCRLKRVISVSFQPAAQNTFAATVTYWAEGTEFPPIISESKF